MTHNLVVNYGLYRMMEVFRPMPVNAALMTRFHSDDYINFLRVITPDNMHEYLRGAARDVVPPRRASGERRTRGASLGARRGRRVEDAASDGSRRKRSLER